MALIDKLKKFARKTAEASRKELILREAGFKKRRAEEAERLAKRKEREAQKLAGLKQAREEAARAKLTLEQANQE